MFKVFNSFKELDPLQARAVCLGNFDGIHRGHQLILSKSLQVAKQNGLAALAFSFEPHPRKFFTQGRQPKLLMNADEKLEFLKLIGFEYILLQNFSEKFSRLSVEDFISKVLVEHLNTKFLVVGREFRFGFQAKGQLEDLKASSDFSVLEQEEVIENQQKISSSWIRRLVELGDIEEANEDLGHPYFLAGKVTQGDGIGRQHLGIPTINIESSRECLPGMGVYLTMAQDLESGSFFPSVTNVGMRPTLKMNRLEFRIESHLIDVMDDFYSRTVRLYFLNRIRDEMKFSGLNELKAQIEKDIQVARQKFQSMQFLQTSVGTMKWSIASPPDAAQAFQAFDISKI